MRLVLSMLMNRFSIQIAGDPSAIKEISAFTMVPSTMPVQLSVRA
jgi:hypothetical protein